MENILSKELRNKYIEKVEVLQQIGKILTLGKTKLSTMEQVAKFYQVGDEAIQSVVKRHRLELAEDGVKTYTKDELILVMSKMNFTKIESSKRGCSQFVVEGNEITVGGRGVILFTKRSILRIGMLLRDSNIAKELRSRLLDIKEAADNTPQNNGLTITENTVNQIKSEEEIYQDIFDAMKAGNIEKVSFLQTLLITIKENKLNIANNTIKEQSKQIITRDAILNSLDYKRSFTRIFGEYGLVIKRLNNYLISKGYLVRMKHPNGKCNNALPTDKIPKDCYIVKQTRRPSVEYKGVFLKDRFEYEAKWTPKGTRFIMELLLNDGILDIVDNSIVLKNDLYQYR